MRKIPFYLVTGFLGSGKTTFLKEFLNEHADSLKIAVIQNELAPAGIDGVELKDTGWTFNLMEVNDGSVFCVCRFSGFKDMLTRLIKEEAPDLIILEASGIADPVALGELISSGDFRDSLYLARVWSVIDGLHFQKARTVAKCIDGQLRVADDIILNKADLLTPEDRQTIESIVKNINPLATLWETSFGRPLNGDIHTLYALDIIPESHVMRDNIRGAVTEPDKRLITQVFRTPHPIAQDRLNLFISTLDSSTFRLKGYILLENAPPLMIQHVLGKTDLIPLPHYDGQTLLTHIGLFSIDYAYYFRKDS